MRRAARPKKINIYFLCTNNSTLLNYWVAEDARCASSAPRGAHIEDAIKKALHKFILFFYRMPGHAHRTKWYCNRPVYLALPFYIEPLPFSRTRYLV